MNYLEQLSQSFGSNLKNNAFCIKDTFYTYKVLIEYINQIRQIIRTSISKDQALIGLVLNDDLRTYANIFALWFEGKGYIPINPDAPIDRNKEILQSADVAFVFDSLENNFACDSFTILNSENSIEPSGSTIESKNDIKFNGSNIAYILFTSGSTGKPKGIPISFKNLNSLIHSLNRDIDFQLDSSDRCLQMYDLTFDASLTALLPGLFAGACIYTVPPNVIKYFHILKLLNKYELTVLKMVPSIINYLRPYFSQIKSESVRYCIFGGGKLFEDILKEWKLCIPNSKMINHYGPTESTVCSHRYYLKESDNKTHNGIVAIGKPWDALNCIIVDDEGNEVPNNTQGELCIAGDQVTVGYWKNEKKNETSFFEKKNEQGSVLRYYKTGDICYRDNDGDFFYVERVDFQVKIRGFRVELSEIEYFTRQKSGALNIHVIDVLNKLGNTEIVLAIEADTLDKETITDIKDHLKSKLPAYMVPTQIENIKEFPMNINGKLDRNKLRDLLKK